MAKVCLYNGTDLDGICSAAIIKNKFPEVIMHPMDYNYDIDCDEFICDDDDVYIVGFAIQPFEKMIEINERSNLVWIDHHETSIRDYQCYLLEGMDKIKGYRNISKGSCELTWEHIYPNILVPYSVWLLGRYDIGDLASSLSVLPFQFGMMLDYQSPDSVIFWDRVFNAERDGSFIHGIIHSGRTIINYRNKLNSKLCEIQAFGTSIDGYRCIAINRALCGSTVFNSVWNSDNYDMMVIFYVDGDGMWSVSLYSELECKVHVGDIAKKYGGGGDARSAGFRCQKLPFDIGC